MEKLKDWNGDPALPRSAKLNPASCHSGLPAERLELISVAFRLTSGFSTTGFSPHRILTHGFSPTGFSPTEFSPTGFSTHRSGGFDFSVNSTSQGSTSQ